MKRDSLAILVWIGRTIALMLFVLALYSLFLMFGVPAVPFPHTLVLAVRYLVIGAVIVLAIGFGLAVRRRSQLGTDQGSQLGANQGPSRYLSFVGRPIGLYLISFALYLVAGVAFWCAISMSHGQGTPFISTAFAYGLAVLFGLGASCMYSYAALVAFRQKKGSK